MLQCARHTVYWPKIQDDISKMVQKCNECQRHSNKKPRPPERQISATHPMEILGMDLVNFRGQHALIKVDYYSGCLTYDTLVDKTIDAVTAALKYIDITKAQTTHLDTSVSNILTSPAELFYSRRTNIRLSMAPAHLKPMKRDLPAEPTHLVHELMNGNLGILSQKIPRQIHTGSPMTRPTEGLDKISVTSIRVLLLLYNSDPMHRSL